MPTFYRYFKSHEQERVLECINWLRTHVGSQVFFHVQHAYVSPTPIAHTLQAWEAAKKEYETMIAPLYGVTEFMEIVETISKISGEHWTAMVASSRIDQATGTGLVITLEDQHLALQLKLIYF